MPTDEEKAKAKKKADDEWKRKMEKNRKERAENDAWVRSARKARGWWRKS